ncbi:acyltransferase family protein [Arthrobacter pigmenti]
MTSVISKPATGTKPAFRSDIQGLRAIAVALVVIYHLWPEPLSGGYAGVDVFFVISGYLITSHLLSAPPRNLNDLGRFWSRRIRRLLPACLLVLGASSIATRLFLPSTQWSDSASQTIASALYVQNWLLAGRSVDYLAADSASSPVQHFWSLSVEEQFYLAWPLLIMAAYLIATRRRFHARRFTRTLITVVILASLAFSILATAAEPASAYFITPTRIWELAIGGFAATLGSANAKSRHGLGSAVVSWCGITAIIVTGFAYTSSTAFPGYAALLPVLGTAAVIVAGSGSRWAPTSVLKIRPVQWLGNVSYSLYLWHWPLIVIVPFASGGSLGILDKSAILVASLVLAGLTKAFVEDKFRSAPTGFPLRRNFTLAAAGMLAVSLMGAAQLVETASLTNKAEQQLVAATQHGKDCLGAAALAKGKDACPIDTDPELIPDPALAAEDKSDPYDDGCWVVAPYSDRINCTYGRGPTNVAVVGNSHAGHWMPALQKLAQKHDWTITTYLVSRCAPSAAKQKFDTPEKTQNCYDYGQWVLEETSGAKYDLVITSERQSVPILGRAPDTSYKPAVEGYERYLREWAAGGTNILAFKDPTFPGVHIPDCLATNPDDHSQCSATRDEWIVQDPLVAAVRNVNLPAVSSVSFDDLVCAPDRCRGVNGKVVTYFDSSHLSATYVETMAPYMEKSILEALSRGGQRR